MKKLLALALAAAMLLTLAACDAEPAEEETAAPAAETLAETTAATEEATDLNMEETVILDNEDVTFTVGLASENAHLGMTIDAVCVNKTDKNLMFTWNSVSVCGFMFDPLWAQQVAPGESVDSVIYIDTYQLEQYGVTSVDEIEFTLYIFDSDDFMAEPIVSETHTIYPTGLSAETVVLPQRQSVDGEQVFLNNAEFSFIVESFEDTGSAYTLRCYLANHADTTAMFSWENVTVNGCAIDPLWVTEVYAGKQAYSEINFQRSDLEAAGIESVEQIDFDLMVFDLDNWTADPMVSEPCTYLAENSIVG